MFIQARKIITDYNGDGTDLRFYELYESGKIKCTDIEINHLVTYGFAVRSEDVLNLRATDPTYKFDVKGLRMRSMTNELLNQLYTGHHEALQATKKKYEVTGPAIVPDQDGDRKMGCSWKTGGKYLLLEDVEKGSWADKEMKLRDYIGYVLIKINATDVETTDEVSSAIQKVTEGDITLTFRK